jgi:hypothetical protein
VLDPRVSSLMTTLPHIKHANLQLPEQQWRRLNSDRMEYGHFGVGDLFTGFLRQLLSKRYALIREPWEGRRVASSILWHLHWQLNVLARVNTSTI